MSEFGQEGTDQRTLDIEELLEGIRDLEEQPRKELLAKLMEGVFHGPAKKVAVAEAVKSASDETEKQLVVEAVRNAATLEGKTVAAAAAVNAAKNSEEPKVVEAAVKSCSTLEGQKAAAAAAVSSAPNLAAQQEIVASLRKETESVREMISHMVLWSLIVIAVVSVFALAVGLMGRFSVAQPLVIIATAVAATLAGYCLGAASLIGERLRDLAREESPEDAKKA